MLLLLLSPTTPAAETQAAPESPSASTPAAYSRIGKPDTNTLQLEISRRRFQPSQGAGPDVWLVAVSHIGESNYYGALQSFLDEQPLVLYEGVGDPQRNQPGPDEEATSEGLQATLATSLGMAFQLDAIRYDRDHFKNSDMTFEDLESLLVREMRERAGEGSAPNPAFLALMGAMDGSSWLGAVMHVGAKLLGSSPKLKAMTRLMFIEILGGLSGDMSEIQGLPPDMQELLQVLIRERNKVVLRDLTRALRRRSPPRSIAIFYGAGHMADLEKRLRADLDYKPVEDVWLPAIVVQPAKAGLTALEIKTIRTMVEWQMKAFQQAGSATAEPAP